MERGRRVAAPLLGLLLALLLVPDTLALDRVAREGQFGPGFWPRLALLGFAAACAVKAVGEARRGPGAAGAAAPRAALSWVRLGAGIALVLGYVAALPLVGYPAATAAFVAAFMVLAGARAPAFVAAAALAGTTALLYLFVKVVYLPLPKGAGPLEAVTLWLYRALGIF